MGLPILLRRLDRARHSGQVAQRSATVSALLPRMPARFDVPFAGSDRGARRRQTDRRTGRSCAGYTGGRRRSAHAQSRSCQATRAMGAFPAAPDCGRSKFATKSRPAAWQMLKDRRVKDEILRPRFWPRYCRRSTAGSKTGNLESLLTRSHRNCDSNCNFRWADRDTCHGTRPARGAGRDRRPSARRTPEDRVGREAAMKPSRRTDPLHILFWIVVVLFWIGAIGSRHSAHLALLQ
jgi:hypothetical protein